MSSRPMGWLWALVLFTPFAALAKTLVVCPAAGNGCDFSGRTGIQAAVDAAANGDVVRLRAGSYQPEKFRDVPYKQYLIRGFVAVERKRIELVGEPGAVLDGAGGHLFPRSSCVTRTLRFAHRALRKKWR